MTPEAAKVLVAALAAAFPYPRQPEPTTQLYVNALVNLDEDIAGRVVADIVHSETRWPPLAVVLDAYRRALAWSVRDIADERGLPEPSERPPVPAEVHAWLARQRDRADDQRAVVEAARERLAWQDTTPLDDLWPQPSPHVGEAGREEPRDDGD